MSIYENVNRGDKDPVDRLEIKERDFIAQAFFRRKLGSAGNQFGRRSGRRTLHHYDTTLGGNKGVNPLPQFTRYSDIKDPPIFKESKGMGRYYKEAIDDNQQRLSLCFGVPEYNPISRFIGNFYDPDLASLVHGGEVSLSYKAGYAIGTFFTLPFQVFFGLGKLVNRIGAVVTGNPYSKFYYLKPTMPVYWNAVTLLFNKVSVDMGALTGTQLDDVNFNGDEVVFKPAEQARVGLFAEMMPDVIRPFGNDENSNHIIDVKSVAGRSQRMAAKFESRLKSIAESVAGSSDPIGEFETRVRALQYGQPLADTSEPRWPNMTDYVQAYSESELSRYAQTRAIPTTGVDEEGNPIVTNTEEVSQSPGMARSIIAQKPSDDSFGDYLMAELREGSLFANFNVDYVGATSVSFSNSKKTAPLKESANSISRTARDAMISFAGGNLTDNIIGNTVESAVTSIANLLEGGLDSVGIGGIGALAGRALMDMPDIYDDSTAELPAHTYKIRLGTPYGNKFSILTRIYLPLCMLLAGALPRRTGKNSYYSPFICSAHSQGFQDTKLGMISDLSIEIGTGNLGRSVDGLPTAVDITLTVMSMDSIISVPVADSLVKEVASFSPFDEENTLNDLLTTLAGVSLQDQYYFSNRISRAWQQQAANWESFTSPSFFAQWGAATGLGQMVSAFLKAGDI